MFKWNKSIKNPIISLQDFEGKNYSWMNSHTQLAIPFYTENGGLRIYFNSRTDGRSRPTFVELDDDFEIIHKNEKPLLSFGRRGCFDDDGVMFSSLLKVEDKIYAYYSGWNVPLTARYHNSIGVAISTDGGNSFYKYSEGPILERSIRNPIMTAGPYVVKRKRDYIMYYLSCSEWIRGAEKPEPVYDIHYALSEDAIHWKVPKDHICIEARNEAIAQPSVIYCNDKYHMWYSHRKTDDYRKNKNNSYRIGYAQSTDGIEWIRKDEDANIDISDTGWDSEMIEYPYVIRNNNRLLLFYNGNGFGRTGIGLAVAKLKK